MVRGSNSSGSGMVAKLSKTYNGRRCFITGHTGFKGSWLCLWLHKLGADICGYALDPPTDPSLFELARIGDLIEDVRGDVREYKLLAEAIHSHSPEFIFHLAAQPLVRTSYEEPKETFDVNIGGLVNLLEAARACPSLKAVVIITSDKCYRNHEWPYAYRETDELGGHDPYSASKASAEIVCSAYGVSFLDPSGIRLATCRAGNVIGGGDWAQDRVIPDVVRAIESNTPAPIRNPASVRPWQHVLDSLYGYLLLGAHLLEEPGFSGGWNFGPELNDCRTVRELVESFLEAYGEGDWEDMSQTQASSPHEAHMLRLASDKAKHFLNWRPTWRFEKAVQKTGFWYREVRKNSSAKDLCLEQIRSFEKEIGT